MPRISPIQQSPNLSITHSLGSRATLAVGTLVAQPNRKVVRPTAAPQVRGTSLGQREARFGRIIALPGFTG